MTPDTLAKLDEGFSMGFSDREACLYADIHPATLYRYCEENPEYSERKELLKENLKMIAKRNIYTEIGGGDKDLSWKYIQVRDPDFIPKKAQDITSGGERISVAVVSYADTTAPSIHTEELSATPIEELG